uniref:Uncharacterized protein n=1 Tax=Cacopsylla melanoneura TaxID=428564 RepID=A0A8D8Q520_9HEMI
MIRSLKVWIRWEVIVSTMERSVLSRVRYKILRMELCIMGQPLGHQEVCSAIVSSWMSLDMSFIQPWDHFLFPCLSCCSFIGESTKLQFVRPKLSTRGSAQPSQVLVASLGIDLMIKDSR